MIVPQGVTVPDSIKSSCQGIAEIAVSRYNLLLGRYPSSLKNLLKARAFSPDIIISDFNDWSVEIAAYLKRTLKKPWFVILWDPPFGNRYEVKQGLIYKVEHAIRLILYNQTIKSADRCFCFINQGVLKSERLTFRRVTQLVNGVDASLIAQIKAKQITKKSLSICVIGRVRKDKGSLQIIRAFEAIANTFPESTLTFVGPLDGDPASKQIISEAIKNSGVQNNIRITGRIPFHEAMEIVAASVIGLHAYSSAPYLYFNHVLKVGEYQALGTIPVAINYPGTSDIIKDGHNGILLTSNDPEAISEAVIDVFASDELQKNIRSNAENVINERPWVKVTGDMLLSIQKDFKTTRSAYGN